MAVFSPEGNPMKCPAFMRMVPRAQASGFTMVEVLVVMAIVILLATLLLPVGKKMIELSKSTQCISNLKSLYMASMTYAQDHNMEIPCSYVNPYNGHCWYQALAGDPKTGQPTLTNGYLPLEYGVRPNVLSCPGNPAIRPSPNGTIGRGSFGWTNYAINDYLYYTTGPWLPKRLSATESSQIFLMDSFNGIDGTTFAVIKGNPPWADLHAVHGDRINVVFLDGHVESPKIFPRNIDPVTGDLNELRSSWFVKP